MARLWISAAVHVGDIFLECGHALVLKPVELGGKVALDLGMARRVAAILTQYVFSEQILSIATGPRADRDHEQGCASADLVGDFDRHNLDLRAERARGLVFSHRLENLQS